MHIKNKKDIFRFTKKKKMIVWKTYETLLKEDMALLASEHGYRDLFELLVDEHGGLDVTEQHLQYAAMYNHPGLVRIILDRLPELTGTDALGAAIRRGFTQVARILLADPRVLPGDAIVWAARTHNATLTGLLAADPRTSREDVAQALRTTLTARDGSAAVARVLLEQDAIPREELAKRLLMAPNPGIRRVLQEYLGGTPRPLDAALMNISSGDLGKLFQGYSYDQNVFWRIVATREMTLGDIIYDLADTRDATPEWYRGRDRVLSWLLDMRNRGMIAKYFKRSMRGLRRTLMWEAARLGYVDLLYSLIQKHGLDPSAHQSEAILAATMGKQKNTFRVLLADARVAPGAEHNMSIYFAIKNGDVEILKMLITDPRVDPSIDDSNVARWASFYGRVDVLWTLLTDPRIDPSGNDNDAVIWAAALGHVDVLRMLLSDPRVDPSAQQNFAIRRAATSDNNNANVVVEILLSQPRVRKTLTKDMIESLLYDTRDPEIHRMLEDLLREIQRGGPVDDSEPPTKMIKEPLFFI